MVIRYDLELRTVRTVVTRTYRSKKLGLRGLRRWAPHYLGAVLYAVTNVGERIPVESV